MFKSIASFFTALILTIVAAFTPAVPEPLSEDKLSGLTDICKDFELGDKLYVLDSATFKSAEERHMAVSLQGIVAKKDPQIFIVTNGICNDYLEEFEASGVELIRNDENGNKWTLASLLNKFKSYITDSGYVLYKPDEKAIGLNIATNLAAIYGWLPVPATLEQLAKDEGLTLKEDYSQKNYNVLLLWDFFEKYKDEFNYNAVMSLKYEVSGLRDLAIQQGFFTFYIDDDEDTNLLRGRIMKYAGDNVPVLGWVKYEVAFVDQASKNGNIAIPADHSNNNSYLASFKCDIPEIEHVSSDITADPSKHYCAILISDGDNMQWIQNGYAEFYRKLSLEQNFPVTWSFPPLLNEFSSATVKKIYSDASENDYFMAGVSGAGYIHPTQYPKDALAGFTDLTAASMNESHLRYVSLLDSAPENEIQEFKLTNSLEYYARYDNIDGGIVCLDPGRYAGGNGRVYFVNDKPFASVRLSLWHPSGEGAEVTTEWLDEQAEIVNSYPADINSVNGYSVINYHPWSVSIDNLAYFVSQLDENVELVTVDELLTIMKNNVPHETASPN